MLRWASWTMAISESALRPSNMLGSFGASAKQSIPRLSEMLFHEEERGDSRIHMYESLSKIGADANPIVSRMLKGLKSPDKGLRIRAAERLARFGKHASRITKERVENVSFPIFWKLHERITEDARARCAIIQLLGVGVKAEEVAPELANLLDDDDEGVRKRAMQALEHYRPASVALYPEDHPMPAE